MQRRPLILVSLLIAAFVINLDITIVNVALPTLVRDLHASNTQLQWVVDAYSLVFAGLLFTGGSLGDRYGRKGLMQIGLLLFGLGAALSTIAGSADQLIGTRAVMGVGGALVMPA